MQYYNQHMLQTHTLQQKVNMKAEQKMFTTFTFHPLKIHEDFNRLWEE
jgi:hypothetical protein